MIGCYILYSEGVDKYYIGVTQDDVTTRISKHNHGFYKSTFTSISNDWDLFLFIECSDFSQALRIEKRIKKMKSRIYIKNLKKFPELIQRLKLC